MIETLKLSEHCKSISISIFINTDIQQFKCCNFNLIKPIIMLVVEIVPMLIGVVETFRVIL